jgi:hypothetical protein
VELAGGTLSIESGDSGTSLVARLPTFHGKRGGDRAAWSRSDQAAS